MKRINIVRDNNPVSVHGRYLPFGAVYGKYPITVTVLKRTNTVTGRRITRPETVTLNLSYYIDDFRYCPEIRKPAYYIHFWDDVQNRWIDSNTAASADFEPFFQFVDDFIIRNHCDETVVKQFVHRSICPGERKADYDYKKLGRNIGYALSSHIMTEDVVKPDYFPENLPRTWRA